MTPAETGKLISMIKSQYQHKFVIEAMTAITWNELLNQDPVIPFEAAKQAALTWMQDNDWPPSVKDLRDIVASTVVGIPDADTAWKHLTDWLKAGYPGMPNRQPPLPPLIADTVRDLGGTSMIRSAEKPEQMRERFARVYDKRRREQMARISVVQSLADRDALNGGDRVAIESKVA